MPKLAIDEIGKNKWKLKGREVKTTSIKVGLSPSKKNYFYLLQWKPFNNDEKSFFFILYCLDFLVM